MNECPCKECVAPKRHIACHGTCVDYITFNEERLKVKREKRKNKNQDAMIDSYVIEQSNKYQHRKPHEQRNTKWRT